jgi:hypothetical protein
LINNRQNGRRRGRGGGPRSPNQAPSPGNNRQENRSRGNASQLLEKYKSLARDAQLQGDRVQSEYYLQFAEHYFRVLNESRARFEEQRRPRDDYGNDDDEDQDEGVSAANDRDDDQDDQDERPDRDDRYDRDRPVRNDRDDRPIRNDRDERPVRADRDDRPVRSDREDRGDRPAPVRAQRDYRDERNGERRPERQRVRPEPRPIQRDEEPEEERISLDVLPPAISPPAISIDSGDAPAKAPRARRPRRVADDDTDIAPAA